MKKRFIPTIIALIILVVLGIYSNYYEVDEILPPGVVKPVDILGFNEESVKSISFGKNENYDLKVELASPTSKIVLPKEYIADEAEAYGVARHFAELKSEYLFNNTTATDTSVFGFNQDSPSVKFETASQVVEITLGSQIPTGSSLYLKRKGDNNIYIVPAHIKGSFEKSLTDLRNKALYFEDFGKCNEIDYSLGTQTYKLVLDSKNPEWIIANTKYACDGETIANLTNNMRNLRISTFEDGDISNEKYSLANPNLYIVIKNESGKTYELKVGGTQGSDTYVSVDNKTVQLANTSNVDNLKLTLNNLREKFLDIPQFADFSEIEVTDATGTLKIVNQDKKWLLGDKVIQESEVKDFVNNLKRAKVSEYSEKQNLADCGLSSPENCSKIVIKAKEVVKTYWLGDVKGIDLFMMDEDEKIKISSEVDSAFKRFTKNLRAADVVVNNN